MPDVERYDILVVGSGEAGKYLAWTMAKVGHRTAMVERKYLGGVPQRRMPAEQKSHLLSESSFTVEARCGIRPRNRFALGQHG